MPVKNKGKSGKNKQKSKSKGKGQNKGNKNKNQKGNQKSNQNRNKQNNSNNPAQSLLQVHGVSYNKEIQLQLGKLRELLYSFEQVSNIHKNTPSNTSLFNYYDTAMQIDDATNLLIELQGGREILWGFEDTNIDNKESKEKLLGRFKQWLITNAPKSHCGEKFDFACDLKQGNGVIALKSIKKDEEVMNIPRNVIFTVSNLENSDVNIRRFLKKDPMAMLSIVIYTNYSK